MFSSRITDKSDYCNIIKHSLVDDLVKYTVNDDATHIYYQDGTSEVIKHKLQQNISTLVQISNNNSNISDYEIWKPIFIDTDKYIDNKMLSDYGSYHNPNLDLTSGRIGIEAIYSFVPHFKSWQMDYNIDMTVDWILNRPTSSYAIYYGILGWYKLSDINNPRSDGGAYQTIENFPTGSRLISNIKPDTIYIKIDNTTLYDISQGRTISNGTWQFPDERKILVLVSSIGDNPLFKLSNIYKENTQTYSLDSLKIQDQSAHLWISDGDFFGCFDSDTQHDLCFQNNIPSQAYISSSLYNIYSNIYRILTIDEPRTFSDKNLRNSRAYKKLAKALSTSPFVTDFCISALDYIEIRKIIQEYIKEQININNISNDLNFLKNILINISKILQNNIIIKSNNNNSLYLDTKSSIKTINNNLIINEGQLFKKLISKYGAQLTLKPETSVSLSPKKTKISYDNSGIVISTVADHYCKKTLNNTLVSNSQKIIFDNIDIEVDNSDKTNALNIKMEDNKEVSIPLVGGAKPGFDHESYICIELKRGGDVKGIYRKDEKDYLPQANNETYIYEVPVNHLQGWSRDRAKQATQEDISSNLPIFGEIDIELSAINIKVKDYSSLDNFQMSKKSFLESQTIVTWEQLDGPPGLLKSVANSAYSSSVVGSNVLFTPTYTGKYTIGCTAVTPFGTYKKTKTFYVVNGIDLYIDTFYGCYWDPKTETWTKPPKSNPFASESIKVFLNTDMLRVITSKLYRIAINNIAGVVWPISTNLKVREDIGALDSIRSHAIFNLSKKYKFTYPTTYKDKKNGPPLSINFSSSNTTIKIHSIFLERIRTSNPDCMHCLSFYEPNISSQNTAFNGQNVTKLYRTNKYPAEFSLIKYKWNDDKQILEFDDDFLIPFVYPYISTKTAPSIQSYGGYTQNFVTDIGVNIPEHPTPGIVTITNQEYPLVSNHNPVLPTISGYKLDYTNNKDDKLLKFCYQKALQLTPTSGSIMKFEKGVLHPLSGWLPINTDSYISHANRCGILKFNPGARDSFTFNGPALSEIKGGNIDISNNTIKSRIYSSTIQLNMSRGIAWDPLCDCGATSGSHQEQENRNQLHKEYIDIDPNICSHGYRILAGGKPKSPERAATTPVSSVNDEFFLDQTEKNIITYSFAVTGPAIHPDDISKSNKKTTPFLRDTRVNDFGIKDIEIQLNFLNYVNTKNLIVWLEVDFDDKQKQSRYSTKETETNSGDVKVTRIYNNPITAGKQFIDQEIDPGIIGGKWDAEQSGNNTTYAMTGIKSSINNNNVYQYLDSLTSMNANGFGEPFKIFLLNQEHIQNNSYNFSVRFSDHANKFKTPYDLNVLTTTTGDFSNPSLALSGILTNKFSYIPSLYPNTVSSMNQNIIKSDEELQPTIAATGYSDRESCLYNAILKNNKLNMTNNTFSKLISDSLFRGPEPTQIGLCQSFPNFNSMTQFKLYIMTIDELDDMNPHDVINYQYKQGFDTVDINSSSSYINSSLCNWELILHVGDTRKPLPHTKPDMCSYGNLDILSLIKYDEPKYYGYSFIADLSRYKHLLPLANYNAPYTSIADSSICLGDINDPINAGNMTRPPEFPNLAILQILSAIAVGSVYMVAGGIAGVPVGLETAMNSPGYGSLYDWFQEIRFSKELENSGREIYYPNYFKYPFGSPEKILINFRKPRDLWHTAEATIFKYHNTPILKPNRYKFIKVERGNGRYISDFIFNIVSDYQDLIDKNIVKNVTCSQNDFDNIKNSALPTYINNTIINNGDLINISLSDSTDSDLNGLYVTENSLDKASSWFKITSQNCSNISKSLSFLTHNAIINGGKTFFTNNFNDYIRNNKVIIIENRIPYDIFAINDSIECYNETSRLSSDNITSLSYKIINKALIFKNNKYYSCFILDKSIDNQNMLSATSNSNIFFIFNNNTSIENKIYKKYNIWGLDCNKGLVGNTTPNLTATTHSVGSYGDLSPFVTKNLLSHNMRYNHLDKEYDIFNNRWNDKIKYNTINILDYNGIAITGLSGPSYGFSYSDKDINTNKIFDTFNNAYYITPENIRQTGGDSTTIFDILKSQIQLSTTNTNENSYQYAYIRANTTEKSNIILPKIGELTIENDLVEDIPLRCINNEELQLLTTRLSIIDDPNLTDTGVIDAIGDANQTSTVLNSSNLKSIIRHYHLLPMDTSKCYRPDNPNPNICYKQKTEQTINNLYLERKEILDLLDQQTIKTISFTYLDNNNQKQTISDAEIVYENDDKITLRITEQQTDNNKITYNLKSINSNQIIKEPMPIRSFKSRTSLPITHPKYLNADILPKISPQITISDINNSLVITYKPINTDHYWINLDPKQSTFKDFESNPKILLETRYSCILANPIGLNHPLNNNVCPDSTNIGEEETDNIDEKIKQELPGSIKYTIDIKKVEKQKKEFQNKYTSIKDWKKFTKIRYFNINGDQTRDMIQASEITVKSEEDYLIPVTDIDLNNVPNNDNSADNMMVPGVRPCGWSPGSPPGSGLLNSSNNRVGKPTRITNICNLDYEDTIEIMIKKIPRLVRGIDVLSTIYRYGFNSIYRPVNTAIPRTPNEVDGLGIQGTLNNNLYYWTCFQTDPKTDAIEKTSLPPFFQLQNEMIFRAFFGSIDKIENKQDFLTSYYPWELIPYEYDRE